MDFTKEIRDRVRENGSLEERCFLERSVNAGKYRENTELIRRMVQALQDEGYTPSEIKGFFEFASRVCNFIKS